MTCSRIKRQEETQMNIKIMKLDDLNPAAYNPRKELKPGDPEYEKLKRSITEFGYVAPIIWNERTKRIVGGHQRLTVLKDLGQTEVECVIVDMDEAKEKALNIALNKISGSWDEDKLAELLKDIDSAGLDATVTGFENGEISEMFDKRSEVQEVTPPRR